jgi:hypothetical protein
MLSSGSATVNGGCLEAALALAGSFGWDVLPLHEVTEGGACSCGKAECKSPGKHPRTRNGLKDGTFDAQTLRRWWGRWPLANIGVCTGGGESTGFFVVGPDGPAGIQALAELERQTGTLPRTPAARTGSGGAHLYFRWPADGGISNRRNHRGLPIDVRGEGGYVVAPPSRNANGPYTWETSPWDADLAEAPAWLVEWCRSNGRPKDTPTNGAHQPHPGGPSIADRASAYLAKMPPAISGQGGHDATMAAARAVVWGFDLGEEMGYQLLSQYYNPRCQPSWSEKELRHKCREAATAPFGKPRGWLLQEDRSHDSRAEDHGAQPASASPADGDGPEAEADDRKRGRYTIEKGRVCRRKFSRGGKVSLEELCNFTAEIAEEVTHDDGNEVRHSFTVRGRLADGTGLPDAAVTAAEFAGLTWTLRAWGARAVVAAGMSVKDSLREAIQLLSPWARRRTVYMHAGWRKIGGAWVYLYAGGAVGTAGTVPGIEVDLPAALAHGVLPPPPEGEALARAVRASVALLGLGPERITVVPTGAAYRAALGSADFSGHLGGPTGVFKTELAALAQQHWGPGFDARHLPGSWSSTANALEMLGFAAKDMLVVIDDYAPAGNAADLARHQQTADRVFRGAGNRSARLRMAADGSLRPPRPPRGLVLSTGEDLPAGGSLRARVAVAEVSRGDIDPARLSACQSDAAAGLLAAAMSGYLRWLAGRYDEVQAGLRADLEALRQEYAAADAHRRTPGVLADLALGWRTFLRFAEEAGALTADECAALAERVRAGLLVLGQAQAEHLRDAEPAALFVRLLLAAIGSGRGHVAGPGGDAPENCPDSWGWRRDTGGGPPCWCPQGKRVGWVDGNNLYLSPEAAHAEANRLAQEQGRALPVGVLTLGKRLQQQGWLASTEGGRERLTVRRTLGGARVAVWHLSAARFLGWGVSGKPSQPSQPAQEDQ